ncbi:PREDICTED: F-box protein At2g17830-like [Camelina sativa]|uniref:F-box protein At2g17830-like n=1 Tax=Camelina sativa TaxID=90675 RepID=A0ABM0TDL5_CAMSA|nr:PREDICTED: F-box protein At2g17830-like [Camelina sativa]
MAASSRGGGSGSGTGGLGIDLNVDQMEEDEGGSASGVTPKFDFNRSPPKKTETRVIKGYATIKVRRGYDDVVCLICFDFTTERFGPRLPLPFNTCYSDHIVTLSSAGEDQLAVLLQDGLTARTEIWVMSKIEPTEVSWNRHSDKRWESLAVDIRQLIGTDIQTNEGSFFIDVKKNVAVVLDRGASSCARCIAYVIVNEGYFDKVDLGESADPNCCHPLVCSYVPSTVQIRKL